MRFSDLKTISCPSQGLKLFPYQMLSNSVLWYNHDEVTNKQTITFALISTSEDVLLLLQNSSYRRVFCYFSYDDIRNNLGSGSLTSLDSGSQSFDQDTI